LGFEHLRIVPGITAVSPLDLYDYPISHGLVTAIGWSVLFGLLYYAFRRNKRNALVVALCVFSHWILDLITHRPDLPLTFGSTIYFGLGLWNSVAGTLLVEICIFIAGVVFYILSTKAKDRVGSYGFWIYIVLLLISYILSFMGPPPPDISAFVMTMLISWLLVAWAYWIDRHRIPRK
jgi:hypothetical protein